MKKYLVGGAVRDMLMGNPANDLDYTVVGSSPDEMISLGFNFINEKNKNIPVFIDPITKNEYALARKEIKTSDGKSGFQMIFDQSVSLTDDLLRRDFTINAIAYDESNKEFIDPFNGISDIKNKLLKSVSPAFKEDPTRVLRLAYFLAKFPDFTVHEETMIQCKEVVNSTEFASIKKPSILPLLKKILTGSQPSKAFYFLKEINALNIVFPEIGVMDGIPQNPKYHPEGCVFTHTMMVLDNARNLAPNQDEAYNIALAGLLHDLGKGITPKEMLPAHREHEERGIPLVIEFCKNFQINNNEKKLALMVCEHHLTIHRALELNPSRLLQLLTECNAIKDEETFKKALIVCEADDLGKLNTEYKQINYLIGAIAKVKGIKIKEFDNKYLAKRILHEEQVNALKSYKKEFLETP